MFLFHSFVEGIAIGSSFSMLNFTLILTSLLIHKAIESFCFSNQLQQISKEVFHLFFIILNAVIVIISFYYGISLKDLIFLENTEAYCDLITASSLLFLIVFVIKLSTINHAPMGGTSIISLGSFSQCC